MVGVTMKRLFSIIALIAILFTSLTFSKPAAATGWGFSTFITGYPTTINPGTTYNTNVWLQNNTGASASVKVFYEWDDQCAGGSCSWRQGWYPSGTTTNSGGSGLLCYDDPDREETRWCNITVAAGAQATL